MSLRKILVFLLPVAAIFVFCVIYIKKIYDINKYYYHSDPENSLVALRKFPYPYMAALAISNDMDDTQTLDEFLEIQKFINTREMTSMGQGIGLNIGNSFLPYEPANGAISYFSGDPNVSATIIRDIRNGSIDVIHSYGKKPGLSRSDEHAMLQELRRNDCRIEVWVDHDRSPSNLGDDVTFGLGDHPGAKEYHADLTLRYGIRFAWLGRVTMIAGQAVPIRAGMFATIFDRDHPVYSAINVLKEIAKNALAVFGDKKYAMQENNDLVRVASLDDGQRIYEFIRFDDYWRGVGTGATNKRLAYVISRKTLDRLKEVGGYTIVYTHLGKNNDCPQYICPGTQAALRNLAREYETGNIYVRSTSRLLDYYVAHKYLRWKYDSEGGKTTIRIRDIADPLFGTTVPNADALEGITFYVPDTARTRIFLGRKELDRLRQNPPDSAGRPSVTILAGGKGRSETASRRSPSNGPRQEAVPEESGISGRAPAYRGGAS